MSASSVLTVGSVAGGLQDRLLRLLDADRLEASIVDQGATARWVAVLWRQRRAVRFRLVIGSLGGGGLQKLFWSTTTVLGSVFLLVYGKFRTRANNELYLKGGSFLNSSSGVSSERKILMLLNSHLSSFFCHSVRILKINKIAWVAPINYCIFGIS